MASKLTIFFLLLAVVSVCLSARISRKVGGEASSSSEEDESFDKIKERFEKLLNDAQKNEFNKIVEEVNAAKTLEETLDATMKMISFAISGIQNETAAAIAAGTTASPIADNKV